MHKIEGVNISTAVPEALIRANIVDAREHSLSPINICDDWREGRTATIIGGGPSLSSHIEELQKEDFTIACGSVHDYLIRKRIYPRYCIICDPDPIMARYLTLATERTTYLIATQCDRAVFNILRYRHCYTWDSAGPTEFNDAMFKDSQSCIPGGCTIGTRAIFCAIGMGFKKFKLYGMDSCIDGDKHHSYNFVDPTKEELGNITTLKLEGSDKEFRVAGYMLAQIFDFQKILEKYSRIIEIEAVGDGVLTEILRLGKLKAQEGNYNGHSK